MQTKKRAQRFGWIIVSLMTTGLLYFCLSRHSKDAELVARFNDNFAAFREMRSMLETNPPMEPGSNPAGKQMLVWSQVGAAPYTQVFRVAEEL